MKLIGRDREIEEIEDCITVASAGLHQGEGPLGVFMLAGPTGCGKTRTVEYLADKWHGSVKNFVKVDCGEYQLEHEVAKLVGAPPGYLGHRETVPFLTQAKLAATTSQNCKYSFVLFDEIEKAAPSMQRLLLGVLDKARLRLGDNTVVDFSNSIIFFTSNLGTRGLFKENRFLFEQAVEKSVSINRVKDAITKHFSPEFVNRLSNIFVYHPLTEDEVRQVVVSELGAFAELVRGRFVGGSLIFDDQVVSAMLERGYSAEFGGRFLKRAIQKHVVIPLAKWAAGLKPNNADYMRVALGWNGALVIDQLPSTGTARAQTERPRRVGKG